MNRTKHGWRKDVLFTEAREQDDAAQLAGPEIAVCPVCTGEGATLLGPMGNLTWFRCRHCGADFNLRNV